MYVSPGYIKKNYLNVSPQTLRRWSSDGLILSMQVGDNGKYKYYLPDIVKMCKNSTSTQNNNINQQTTKKKIVYARVSSSKQKEDLQRQIEFLQRNYPNHQVYSDVGSGINFKRRSLISILEFALQGNLEELVVAHRDRLCRFGFELFEWIFKETHTTLVVHSNLQNEHKSSEQELAEDLLAIVTVFAAKNHGKRSYSMSKDSNQTKSKRSRAVKEMDRNISLDV